MNTLSFDTASGPGDEPASQRSEKFDRIAAGYSEHDYADPIRYAARRAALIVDLAGLRAGGATVLDLGCGDGLMGDALSRYGLRYRGVDASDGMIAAARARRPDLPFAVARSEEYEPPEPVDVTICLRAFSYPPDRLAFFRAVRGYTRRAFVFDFAPRVHETEAILDDLRAAGFSGLELRPFLLPQRHRLPGPTIRLVDVLERGGPLADLLARRFGRLFCAATCGR